MKGLALCVLPLLLCGNYVVAQTSVSKEDPALSNRGGVFLDASQNEAREEYLAFRRAQASKMGGERFQLDEALGTYGSRDNHHRGSRSSAKTVVVDGDVFPFGQGFLLRSTAVVADGESLLLFAVSSSRCCDLEMATSADSGLTWSQLRVVNQSNSYIYEISAIRSSSGRIFVIWSGNGIQTIDTGDGGRSWSAPVQLTNDSGETPRSLLKKSL